MAGPKSLEMGEFLSEWYTKQTTFADLATEAGQGIVRVEYVVKEYHADPAKKPNLRGKTTVDGRTRTNTFVIDGLEPPHTPGHLLNMPIFQGHLADGALIEAEANGKPDLWLTGIRSLTHSEPGVPGDTLVATTILLKEENDTRVVKGNVTCGERVHTRVFDMKLASGPSLPSDEIYLPQHALFEIGAQAVGGTAKLLREDLFEGDQKRDPVYASIGQSTLEPVILRPDDVLNSLVKLQRVSGVGAFYADVDITRQGERVAFFGNLGIGFLPHDLIEAKIKELQHSK